MNLQKIKAVIFDMDGLMLDTERIAWETFQETCQEYAVQPDQSLFLKTLGKDWQTTRQILAAGFGKNVPLEQLCGVWQEKYLYRTMYETIPVKPGLQTLLILLNRLGLQLAVGTTTKRSVTLKKLTNTGLINWFPVIVCGDEVPRAKPAPDIFLKAAELLNRPPAACLVLEDSDNGIKAARTAGMAFIQVPDLKRPAIDVLEYGHPVVSSLSGVAAIFNKLI